jgi:hypothetical protein
MDNWEIAITCTFPHEAHLIEGYLNSQGIETSLKDEMTVQVNTAYSNAVGGVKVLVRASDYDHTIQLLKIGGYIVDPAIPENVENKILLAEYTGNKKNCPFCNSENITIKKKQNALSFILSIFLSLSFFAVIAPVFRSAYKCFDCEREWRYIRR